MWIKTLYEELGYQQEQPVLILGDNDGSITVAKNPGFHKWSKHIAIRWHWLRDRMQDKSVYLEDCRDPQNTADILTKSLTPDKFCRHVAGLGLSSAWGGVLTKRQADMSAWHRVTVRHNMYIRWWVMHHHNVFLRTPCCCYYLVLQRDRGRTIKQLMAESRRRRSTEYEPCDVVQPSLT